MPVEEHEGFIASKVQELAQRVHEESVGFDGCQASDDRLGMAIASARLNAFQDAASLLSTKAGEAGKAASDDAEESNPYVRSPVVEAAIEQLEKREQEAKDALAEHRKERDPMGITQRSLVRYTEARIYRDAILILADADYERHVFSTPGVAEGLEEADRTIEEWKASLAADAPACCGREDGKHEPFCDVGNYSTQPNPIGDREQLQEPTKKGEE